MNSGRQSWRVYGYWNMSVQGAEVRGKRSENISVKDKGRKVESGGIYLMSNRLMSGFWRFMLSVPPFLWEKEISKSKKRMKAGLAFMSREHRLVHHHVVRELPHAGEPLAPDMIAESLKLSAEQVNVILNELEEHKTFLFRNSKGAVVWAYPVTVEETPHHITFSTGEQLYAA